MTKACIDVNSLTAIRRQVENKNGEKGDGDARNDEVDGVKQRLAADRDVERDIRIRLRAASVVLLVLLGRNAQQIPFDTRVEVLQLDADLQWFQISHAGFVLDDVLQVDLQ